MCNREQTPWELKFSKRAKKDMAWHREDGRHIGKVIEVLETISQNPFERSQGYKALKGDMKGLHERRISKQFRIIYSADKEVRIVRIVSAKQHT